MPEGVGYSGANSPVSIGNEFNVVQRFAYAYSGPVGVANSETTVLQATTGNKLMEAKLQLCYVQVDSNDDMEWQIYLDGVLMAGAKNSDPQSGSEFDNPLYLILPPYTTIKVTAKNASSGSTRNMGCLVTGVLY